MIRSLLLPLVLLFPLAARAQLVLSIVNGGTEAPAGATYILGQVAVGDTRDVRFRARNTTSAAVPITTLAISGAGFSIASPLTPPPNIPPGNFLDIYVHFSGGMPGSYSATLQINRISVLLIATAVPAPALTTLTGCTGPDPTTAMIDFGTVKTGQTGTCALVLVNHDTQPLTITTLAVTGPGFQLAHAVPTPLTLATGQSASLSINFAPSAGSFYSGLLTVDARSYPLKGAGINPALPAITLGLGSEAPRSGEQRELTMQLSAPSPIAISGSVNLAFHPESGAVIDDPAIVFTATGARSVPFSIKPGDTQVLLAGQTEAVFQTGTTAGTITFTVSANAELSGDTSATLTIPPAIISIDTAEAVALAGELDVQVRGFDNTYSAGPMSFTFYDTAGRAIADPIHADFTANFHNYFAASQSGSTFQTLVTFPVTGEASQVGAVDVQMTNSTGSTATQHLLFIGDAPQCAKTPSGLICNP